LQASTKDTGLAEIGVLSASTETVLAGTMDLAGLAYVLVVPFLIASHALIHAWWYVRRRDEDDVPPALVDLLAFLVAFFAGMWTLRTCLADTSLDVAAGCAIMPFVSLFYGLYCLGRCIAMRAHVPPPLLDLDGSSNEVFSA
jgi:hypothetical protein